MTRITAELTSGTQVVLSDGTHRWRADEPESSGGTDTGPSPYEMLLGALAACTCMTLAMYCRHKDIPLKSVVATYEHDRVHTEDCRNCEDPDAEFLDRANANIRLVGEFSEEQRDRLTQIAARCPVHKTLDSGLVLVDHVSFA